VVGEPTGGSFTLSFQGAVTSSIDYDAAASDVEDALSALATVGQGNVSCDGGPLPDAPVQVMLEGRLTAPFQPLIVANWLDRSNNSTLTGGTGAAVEVISPPGNVPTGAEATIVSDECETITIVGSPVGGHFTLSFGGEATGPIYWNATPADIVAALEGLSSVGKGNVANISASFPSVAGTVVAFIGGLAAARQELLGANFTDSNGDTTLKTTGWGLELSSTTTGGYFTLAVNGRQTDRVPYDADAATVQTVLEDLVGSGNVAVADGALPKTPIHIEFTDESVTLSIGVNGLQGNQGPIPRVIKGNGDEPSVAVSEFLEGGQTIGPQDVDETTGQTTFLAVPNGEWELTVTADHYEDLAQRFTCSCPPKTPLGVGGQMTPEDGYLIFPNSGTPYKAPGALTVTDPLGSTTLALVGFADGKDPAYPKGTAFYSGKNTFNPIQRTCTYDPAFCPDAQPVTVNTFKQAITYWASVGCATSAFAFWVYDLAGTFVQGGCGCAGPISPPDIGGNTTARLCGFPFENGILCDCTVSNGTAGWPALVTLGICYGVGGSGSIAGNPVDITFDVQWEGATPCDGLAGLLHYLYAVPFLVGGQTLHCITATLSE
jgi:hypothetical protein